MLLGGDEITKGGRAGGARFLEIWPWEGEIPWDLTPGGEITGGGEIPGTTDSPVHTITNCLRIQKFTLWRADSKSCGLACE